MSVEAKAPSFTQILTQVEKATGVRFAIDVAGHEPKLGVVKLIKVPAWAVLDWLSERDMRGGRWEKAGAGYQLRGTSLARASTPEPPAPTGRSWWWTVAVAGIAAGAIGVAWRRRKRHLAATGGKEGQHASA